jgi:hypothetical protein
MQKRRIDGEHRAARHPRRSPRTTCFLIAVCCSSCAGTPDPREGAAPTVDHAPRSPSEAADWTRPEDAWLGAIGRGQTQTAKVCKSGAKDRIVESLCTDPPPPVDGMQALYEALGLVGEARSIASTTHSLGLSARTVTAANPRTFAFMNTAHYPHPLPYDKFAVVTFARGEQLVEMVALDTNTYDWNFYVLAFEQACNESRCTPEDLLTARVEQGWKRWTLYSSSELVDTPLDCNSCHQPFGEGTHKLLLMRQLPDPWIHWGDFRGVDEGANCSQDGPKGDPKRRIPGEGLNVLLALEGQDGQHAGIAVADLYEAKSGRDFGGFMVNARLSVNSSPYGPNYLQHELELDSARILCELLDNETSEIWQRYRSELTEQGFPVAYYGVDVLDPRKRQELLADRRALLSSRSDEEALDVAASWMSAEVAEAVGLVPRETDTAPQILRQMCVRCHAAETPNDLRRAGFNAENLGSIDPLTAEAIRSRIHLPRQSPKLMPPLRAGELPPSAIARIEEYLKTHCTTPGACD